MSTWTERDLMSLCLFNLSYNTTDPLHSFNKKERGKKKKHILSLSTFKTKAFFSK